MTDLNSINYLNLFGYILNTFVTFFATDLFQLTSIEDLSKTYQTIITPAGYAFSIWGGIFLSEGIFTVCQLLPKYRDMIMIQEGVSFWYFVACIFQSTWVFFFGMELILLSTMAMIGILFALVMILRNQHRITTTGSKGEYWLTKFPFALHLGWIICATCLNIGVLAIDFGAGNFLQLVIALASIALLLMVAVYSLGVKVAHMQVIEPNYVLPLVFAWATLAIYMELNEPQGLIMKTFSRKEIEFVQILSLICFLFLLIVTLTVAFTRIVFKSRNNNSANENEQTLLNS